MQSILNQWSCNRCHEAHDRDQKYNKTRNLGVARVGADRTDCHWPKRSSKVDDFYVLWKAEIFFWEFYAKIKHFWCKIVTCFKMHLVNRGGGRPPPSLLPSPPLNPPLINSNLCLILHCLAQYIRDGQTCRRTDEWRQSRSTKGRPKA